MKSGKWRVLACVLAITFAGVSHGYLSAQAAQDTLTYRFAKGDQAKYSLKFRRQIKMRGQHAQSGVMTHSFVYRQEVSRIRQSGNASLDIDLLETRYKMGENVTEFDSRNKSHLDAAKTNEDLRIYAAILTAKGKMGVKSDGQVAFFRLASLAPRFNDEQTKQIVTRVIEEIKNHAFLPVPGTPIENTQSWHTYVPIMFLGSPLHGMTIFAKVTLGLDRIDGTGANRMAHYTVQSFETPELGLTEGSLKDIETSFKLRSLDGTVTFAVAKGLIQSYQFRIQTYFKLMANGSLIQEHEMDEQVSLELHSN